MSGCQASSIRFQRPGGRGSRQVFEVPVELDPDHWGRALIQKGVKKVFLKIKALRSIKNDCGFTLIEVVIAIAIISFALGSLVLMVTGGFGGVSGAAHKSHATHTAQNQIERGMAYLQGALESKDTEVFVPADINLKDETIELRFQDVRTGESGEVAVVSSGKLIDARVEEKGQESSLLTFIPYEKQ